MDRNENFSNLLKEKREELGISQAEAAEACGVSQANWNYWEKNGRPPPNPARREKLAKLLGLSLEEMLEKACVASHDQHNLKPLIETIAKANIPVVTLDDVRFLCDVQVTLDKLMSSRLIEELMGHRIAQPACKKTRGRKPGAGKAE